MYIGLVGGICAAFFMSGCATADIAATGECERFGVLDSGETRTVRNTHALPQAEINKACGRILLPPGYRVAGCALVNDDGSVDLYWRVDDWCVEMHERAHAQCGMRHTKEFNRAVHARHPRPSCPTNPIS